jgi:hypothetical protein
MNAERSNCDQKRNVIDASATIWASNLLLRVT